MSAGFFVFILILLSKTVDDIHWAPSLRHNLKIKSEILQMKNVKTEMEEEISRLFANFIKEQLGEHSTSVKTYLSSNTFTIRSDNCFAAGEKKLIQNEKHWQLLKEVKSREFEQVEPVLKEILKELIGCQILNIYSIVGQDGVRFGFFILQENLENKLLKTGDISP